MEAYKTTCPDCGHVRFWVGYKTGLGKTPEQLEKMKRDSVTCVRCGSTSAQTDLDRESETGQAYDEMDRHAASMIAEILMGKLSDKEG